MEKVNSLRGTVRKFSAGTESRPYGQTTTTIIVWSFVLERYDSNNNQLPPIPIEIRGRQIKGFIREGDDVEIYEKWIQGRVLETEKIYNHTTNSSVNANPGVNKIVSAIIIIVFILGFLYILITGISSGRSH